MGTPEVKGRGECPKIRKRSKGCVEWYTLCAYGSGVQAVHFYTAVDTEKALETAQNDKRDGASQ